MCLQLKLVRTARNVLRTVYNDAGMKGVLGTIYPIQQRKQSTVQSAQAKHKHSWKKNIHERKPVHVSLPSKLEDFPILT